MESKVRCYNYDEINEDLLKQFSEGSYELEKLLKYCYFNKIETRACCIGHANSGPYSKPYICFINCKEQYFLMENLIFLLLSQGEFSNHIDISITNELITFKFNCLDIDLREHFFSLIQNGIINTMNGQLNEYEKYTGLLDIFNKMNVNDNLMFEISSRGLKISESKESFFKYVNDGNDIVEVEEEEADFAMEAFNTIKSINHDKISDFIAEKNEELKSHSIK